MKNFKKYFRLKNYIAYFLGKYKKSYSQHVEDILIESALQTLGVERPSYLDIGANHPVLLNNTFLFYSKGSKGVCVEPNPEIFQKIKDRRRRDICLNMGIGTFDSDGADFYMMSSSGFSTFVKSEAEKCVRENNYGTQKIEKIIRISLIAINTLIEKYFPQGVDLVSLDTEGYDFEILKSLDFKKYRPKVFCVETLRYEATRKLKKQNEIIDYMIAHGYFLYADTYVNSIFVDKRIWPF